MKPIIKRVHDCLQVASDTCWDQGLPPLQPASVQRRPVLEQSG